MADDDLTELALADAGSRMQTAVKAYQRDLQSVRTGRAHPSLVDQLPIDYFGTSMALNQLANISAPEARLIVIQPWDKNAVDPITRAIQRSELGLNPQSDGVLIRLPIPELTEERRLQLLKQVGQKAEVARVAVRNVRRDVLEELRKLERAKDISQDQEHRAHEALDKITQDHVARIGREGSDKERELLEV